MQKSASEKSSSKKANEPLKTACPMCKRQPVEAFSPFCSKRCADEDLSHWLKGTYSIPVIADDKEHPDD